MRTHIIISILLVVVFALGVLYTLQTFGRTGPAQADDNHDDQAREPYELYPGDVVEKIRNSEDIVLLDVRTQEEYEEVHLENALLLPVQELSQNTLAAIGLGEDAKDREIIIYCRSGSRSKQAYDILESLGYTNIKSVQGGMIHWEEDSYPYTETGPYTGPSWTNTRTNISRTPANGPSLVLDRTEHDFGLIPQYGGTVETTFTLTNEGTEVLELGVLSTSCACTKATTSETSIPAGDAATLTVIFDPNLHEEPLDTFKRTIFIPTNDPNTPEAEVTIQVDIDEGV